MTVNRQGIVEHTELVEGIIESVHRGVYEEIEEQFKIQNSKLSEVCSMDKISNSQS
jgi:hypothetical protein